MALGTLGNMRHQVTIEEPQELTGDTGEPIRTWKSVATAWAAIDAAGGRENVGGEQLLASGGRRIWIRRIPGLALSVQHRIVCGSQIFEINDVRDVQQRGAMWDISATEAV